MQYFIRVILLAIILWPAAASAAQPCTNPTGDEGDQVYNTTYHVMQYCNGSHWVAMGSVMGQGDNLGNHTSIKELDMSGFKVRNIAPPTDNLDAVNKQYVDAALDLSGTLPTCLEGVGLISTGTGWRCDYVACTLDGITKEHGESHTFYETRGGTCGETCPGNSRTCVNGTFDGVTSFDKSTCSALPPAVLLGSAGSYGNWSSTPREECEVAYPGQGTNAVSRLSTSIDNLATASNRGGSCINYTIDQRANGYEFAGYHYCGNPVPSGLYCWKNCN